MKKVGDLWGMKIYEDKYIPQGAMYLINSQGLVYSPRFYHWDNAPWWGRVAMTFQRSKTSWLHGIAYKTYKGKAYLPEKTWLDEIIERIEGGMGSIRRKLP